MTNPTHLGFFQSRVIQPVIDLLRIGATPQRLAWSLAIGAVIGINPIIGSTTLLCLGVALLFRLNLIASQIANHLCFPVQIALVVAWLRAGDILFRTGPPPLDAHGMIDTMRHHPWSTLKLLWTWEWHALLVWVLASAVVAPILAALLRPALARLLERIQKPAAAVS